MCMCGELYVVEISLTNFYVCSLLDINNKNKVWFHETTFFLLLFYIFVKYNCCIIIFICIIYSKLLYIKYCDNLKTKCIYRLSSDELILGILFEIQSSFKLVHTLCHPK